MSDLISMEAILKHIEKIRQSVQMMDDTHRASIIMNGMYLCEKAVWDQPSAQPEVIRCKDCKFADWDLDGEGGYCNKMDVNDPFYVDYDFFCAKAERKKNETN